MLWTPFDNVPGQDCDNVLAPEQLRLTKRQCSCGVQPATKRLREETQLSSAQAATSSLFIDHIDLPASKRGQAVCFNRPHAPHQPKDASASESPAMQLSGLSATLNDAAPTSEVVGQWVVQRVVSVAPGPSRVWDVARGLTGRAATLGMVTKGRGGMALPRVSLEHAYNGPQQALLRDVLLEPQGFVPARGDGSRHVTARCDVTTCVKSSRRLSDRTPGTAALANGATGASAAPCVVAAHCTSATAAAPAERHAAAALNCSSARGLRSLVRHRHPHAGVAGSAESTDIAQLSCGAAAAPGFANPHTAYGRASVVTTCLTARLRAEAGPGSFCCCCCCQVGLCNVPQQAGRSRSFRCHGHLEGLSREVCVTSVGQLPRRQGPAGSSLVCTDDPLALGPGDNPPTLDTIQGQLQDDEQGDDPMLEAGCKWSVVTCAAMSLGAEVEDPGAQGRSYLDVSRSPCHRQVLDLSHLLSEDEDDDPMLGAMNLLHDMVLHDSGWIRNQDYPLPHARSCRSDDEWARGRGGEEPTGYLGDECEYDVNASAWSMQVS